MTENEGVETVKRVFKVEDDLPDEEECVVLHFPPEETSDASDMKADPLAIPVENGPNLAGFTSELSKSADSTQQSDNSKKGRRYTCLRCGFITEVDQELRDHMKGKHNGAITLPVNNAPPKPVTSCDDKWKCDECNLSSVSESGLKKHKLRLHRYNRMKTNNVISQDVPRRVFLTGGE